jgi:hypothetical protein
MNSHNRKAFNLVYSRYFVSSRDLVIMMSWYFQLMNNLNIFFDLLIKALPWHKPVILLMGTELGRRILRALAQFSFALNFQRSMAMLVEVENNLNSFLIISGHISGNKRMEFEQTLRLAFGTFSSSCIARCLSADINKEGYYHFFSLWPSENSLKKFIDSTEFQLINGAYHALGNVSHTINGNVTNSQKLGAKI